MEELQEEQRKIEEIARQLYWKKKSQEGETAIWQKSKDADSCHMVQDLSQVQFCKSAN